jgi:S-(hydroxymethyl)glutathione dehydrogenase/alcohol dehydrogenase
MIVINSAIAAVLEQLGKPLSIKEIKIPPLVPGQVLVRVLFSGVCRSQLMEVRGGRGDDPWLPHLLGHEGSGVVIAVGDGVTKVKPDDEVILGWLKGEGVDAPGAKYLCGDQVINSGRVTTFSNYTVVSESRVVRKPANLPMDVAVLFGCALPTGAGMVLNELQPSKNHRGAVIGLGGIGLAALMALSGYHCQEIVAIDVSDEKLRLAQSFGATRLINPTCCDVAQQVRMLAPDGLDFCLEAAGLISTMELGFALIRKGGGKLLFASHPPEGEFLKLSPHELISGKQIAGSWGGATRPDRDIPRMYELFQTNGISMKTLLTKRYSLYQINEALIDIEEGRVFRPLIEMEH